MRRRLRFLMLALAIVSCGGFLGAHVSTRMTNGTRLAWETSRFPLNFQVSSTTAAGTSNLAAGSDPMAAVRASLAAWQTIPTAAIRFADLQTTATESNGVDGINLITMANTTANNELFSGSEAVGLAAVVFETTTGKILECDVILNPKTSFSTNLAASTIDMQTVLTHEMGHALGAGHTPAMNDTMFFSTGEKEFFARNLSRDSIAFASFTYPNTSRAESVGSISGRVTQDGAGVFGAAVTAFNTERNLLYTAVTELDGNYTITGPIPGKYVIYAEPLDGPALENQLGQTFYKNLNTTFRTVVQEEQTFSAPESADPGAGVVRLGIRKTDVNFAIPSAPATLNINRMGKTDPVTGSGFLRGGPVTVTPGEFLRLNIGGAEISTVTSFDDITFLGTGITIDRTRPLQIFRSGGQDLGIGVHIRIAADAAPGPRVVMVRLGGQRVASTGGMVVAMRSLPTRNLYLPYLFTSPDQFTGLALANPSATCAAVRVRASDSDGISIFDADAIVPADLSIAAGAQLAKVESQIFNLSSTSRQTGSMAIESDNASLQSFSLTGDPASTYLDGAEAITRAYKQLHFVDILQNSTTSTEIHLMNVKDTPVTVQLTLVDSDGSARATVNRTIPAWGKIGESVATLFSTNDIFSSAHVNAVATEDALAGFQLIRQRGTVFGVNAQPPEIAAATLYSAQLASGNFGVNFSTRLNVVNVGAAATVSLTVFGENGQQVAGPISHSIPAGGQLSCDAQNFFSLTGNIQGSVRITGDSGAKLLGNVLFGDGDPAGRVLSFGAALPLSAAGLSSFIFSQVAQATGYYTGLAFLATEGANVTVEAFRESGVSDGTKLITLATGARTVRLLQELIPATANRNGGYVKITSTKPVIAFELFGATGGQFLSAVPPQAFIP